MCMCFFLTPSQKNKKKHGVQGSFQKKTQQEVLCFPSLASWTSVEKHHRLRQDFHQAVCWSTFGFLTKHPGFQLLVVDVIGNKKHPGKKQTMNEDVYYRWDLLWKNLDLFIVFLVFRGNFFSSFGLHMGVSENGGTPESSHFNRDFHHKSSILGYHYFWKHPHGFLPPRGLLLVPSCAGMLRHLPRLGGFFESARCWGTGSWNPQYLRQVLYIPGGWWFRISKAINSMLIWNHLWKKIAKLSALTSLMIPPIDKNWDLWVYEYE